MSNKKSATIKAGKKKSFRANQDDPNNPKVKAGRKVSRDYASKHPLTTEAEAVRRFAVEGVTVANVRLNKQTNEIKFETTVKVSR